MSAKEEFLSHIESRQVLCVQISDCDNIQFNLKVGYSAYDFDKFLDQLDYEYDSGKGRQLHGVIWYKDGTWSMRKHFGTEWWEYKSCPIIPDYLKEVNK